MIAVIQRVEQASVSIAGSVHAEIGTGLLIFIGIEGADKEEDIDWLAKKIIQVRLFPDEDRKMNKSLTDIDGNLLVVSQFTLHASTKKGNRPSYIKAAKAEEAVRIYNKFLDVVSGRLGKPVFSGVFGANMQVSLLNDGPVTILIDTKNKQ